MGHFVIAGGSRGIGRAISEKLLAEGHAVTILSRQMTEPLAGAEHLQYDFSLDAALPSGAFEGPLDGIAYCPGSIELAPIHRVTAEAVRQSFELNCVGAIRFVQACLPGLKATEQANASIVLFSTIAAARGLAMHTAIAASKGALEAVARTLAAELAPKIRVNCIAPALTETDLSARFFSTDAKREAMNAMYPLGRTGTAADIAEAATMLLLPTSGWITGQTLGVDGGMSRVQK
ncbi:MAG: SDR family NAD(P)-dependent oxidoreductase [Pirellulales bacterium]|nr:SDR family NAD(P)-dependent oxidoreductase [Pirellulales bacterium]